MSAPSRLVPCVPDTALTNGVAPDGLRTVRAVQSYDTRVGASLKRRWTVCLSVALLLLGLVLDSVAGEGSPFRVLVYIALFSIFLTGPLLVVNGIRTCFAAYLGRWGFRRPRHEFDSDAEAERSWSRFGGRGYSRVIRWLCIPSNVEVTLLVPFSALFAYGFDQI